MYWELPKVITPLFATSSILYNGTIEEPSEPVLVPPYIAPPASLSQIPLILVLVIFPSVKNLYVCILLES